MYDPMALMVAVPVLEHLFDMTDFVVDGVCHKVVGTSKESNGVNGDGERLRQWMKAAFLQGVRPPGMASHGEPNGGLIGGPDGGSTHAIEEVRRSRAVLEQAPGSHDSHPIEA
jgi:hypothetical protein